MTDLANAKVLMLAADGFESVELTSPRDALRAAGATVVLAAPDKGPVQGMNGDIDKADTVDADIAIADVDTADYDALVLPGGVANPDTLRRNERAVEIVQEFMDEGKIVAAICHAPWLLVEADVIEGRRLTGFESIRTDLVNAGGEVIEDDEVVVDDNLITSRCPDDLPAFNRAIVEALAVELTDA